MRAFQLKSVSSALPSLSLDLLNMQLALCHQLVVGSFGGKEYGLGPWPKYTHWEIFRILLELSSLKGMWGLQKLFHLFRYCVCIRLSLSISLFLDVLWMRMILIGWRWWRQIILCSRESLAPILPSLDAAVQWFFCILVTCPWRRRLLYTTPLKPTGFTIFSRKPSEFTSRDRL